MSDAKTDEHLHSTEHTHTRSSGEPRRARRKGQTFLPADRCSPRAMLVMNGEGRFFNFSLAFVLGQKHRDGQKKSSSGSSFFGSGKAAAPNVDSLPTQLQVINHSLRTFLELSRTCITAHGNSVRISEAVSV